MTGTGTAAQARLHRQAALLMTGSSLLFALMGVLVKVCSASVPAGEMVFWRSAVGAVCIAAWVGLRGGTLATPVPAMHFWRSAAGVASLALWFHSISGLPLATAMTLNYLSSVWMALFLIGGSVLFGAARIDPRLMGAVLAGFVGVALVLRPDADTPSWPHALAGLTSGVLAAVAYLQVTALSRSGEPEVRVVFYFSLGGVVLGAASMVATGTGTHTPWIVAQLLAIGVLATMAQVMLTRAYAIGHVLANAALQYLGILWSFLFGALLFAEPVTAWALAGVALIVSAGIAATLLRARVAPAASRDARTSMPAEL